MTVVLVEELVEETGGEPPSKRSATRSRRTSSSAAPRVAAAQQCGLGLREQAASSERPEMLREGGLGALDRRHDGKYVARHRVGGELVVDTKRQGSCQAAARGVAAPGREACAC